MFHKLISGIAVGGMLLVGCTSRFTEKEQYSGYLHNYSHLQEVTTTSGQKTMRWEAASWNPYAYDAIAFKQLDFYPTPRPDGRVNLKTLEELQAYMTHSTKNVLGQSYPIVADARLAPRGSRVLVMRAAITGVSASNEGMHWYEVVPVAATGYRDQDTELYVEAELIDGNNGQTVVKVVRKVFGATLENANQPVTTQDFKVAIDTLTTDLQAFIQ